MKMHFESLFVLERIFQRLRLWGIKWKIQAIDQACNNQTVFVLHTNTDTTSASTCWCTWGKNTVFCLSPVETLHLSRISHFVWVTFSIALKMPKIDHDPWTHYRCILSQNVENKLVLFNPTDILVKPHLWSIHWRHQSKVLHHAAKNK